MAKLYFSYSAMNAGKSTALIQVAHNYREQGMDTYLLNAQLDDRSGPGKIVSRVGLEKPADTYTDTDDLFAKITDRVSAGAIACVLIDEAQWLTKAQVWQLSEVADKLSVPVMCYGIRTDFQGKLFPGSKELLAIADELRELRTICHCGKKATMVLRKSAEGTVLTEGPQVFVGGNETYESVCRKHWKEAFNKQQS